MHIVRKSTTFARCKRYSMAKQQDAATAAKAIIADFDKGKVKPLYVLHGSEPFLCDAITNHILEHLVPQEAKGFDQVLVYASEVTPSQIIALATRAPMVSDRMLVVVREAQNIKSFSQLAIYAEHPLESTVLVLNARSEIKETKGDTKRLLQGARAHGVVFKSTAYRDYQVAPWIDARAKEKGLTLEAGVTTLLKESLGTDLTTIDKALDKLILALPAGKSSVSQNDVLDTIGISRSFNAFELTKALGACDRPRALFIALQMAKDEKSNPIQAVLPQITNYFVRVLRYQGLTGHYNDIEIANRLGVNPYFLREYNAAARRFSSRQLSTIFTWLRYYDLMSKGYYGPPPSTQALYEELIIRLLP